MKHAVLIWLGLMLFTKAHASVQKDKDGIVTAQGHVYRSHSGWKA